MSKLYDAIKRVQESKKSNNTDAEYNTGNGKKPNKKIIKWVVLFAAIIVIGILVVYITNFIRHKHKSNSYVTSNPHSLNIKVIPGSGGNDDGNDKINLSKMNNTNATTHSQEKLNTAKNVNATQTTNSTNSTGVNLKPNIQITQSQPQIIVNYSDNKMHSLNSTKQEQLNNVLNYQQEKAEKLSDLALNINRTLENGDYYRAKLLLKEYLSIQEDSFALNDLAAIYIQEGKYAPASELLEKSITQQQSAAAYVNLIYCYKKLNGMDKIKDILKTVNPSIFSEEQKALIDNIINGN
jgi:tetratricopeptide (TPR) repeat protein